MIAADLVDLVVIDDDDDLRMLARLTFQLHGWNVDTAADGASGILALEGLVSSGATPAVLLDVQMPEIDGWEVLTRIRAHEFLCDLPVLLCTVRAGDQDRARAMALGADGFVAKPFDIDDLVDEVRRTRELDVAERARRRAASRPAP